MSTKRYVSNYSKFKKEELSFLLN